jgi:hypothetical protein
LQLREYGHRSRVTLMVTGTFQDLLEHYKPLKSTTPFKTCSLPSSLLPGSSIRPDIEVTLNGARLMIDVVVAFDDPVNLEVAYKRKLEKYQEHGVILPLYISRHILFIHLFLSPYYYFTYLSLSVV